MDSLTASDRALQRVSDSRFTVMGTAFFNSSQRIVEREKNEYILSSVPKNVMTSGSCLAECTPAKFKL